MGGRWVVDGWCEVRERRAAPLGAGRRAAPQGWRLPSTAALVRARRRVGARLLRELFHAVAGPGAAPTTPGAVLGGLRRMAVDGTTLDVADTPANARAFGRPASRRGPGAFPQLRVVALIEAGTHALGDVVLRPFAGGEAPAARHLVRAVGPGMLLPWDRGFPASPGTRWSSARWPGAPTSWAAPRPPSCCPRRACSPRAPT